MIFPKSWFELTSSLQSQLNRISGGHVLLLPADRADWERYGSERTGGTL